MFDAVKACSCWRGDSRCPSCAHFQSQVDELEWYDACLVDLDSSAYDTDDSSDIRSCSSSSGDCDSVDSSSDEAESSSGGEELASGASCNSCRHSSSGSSKPVVPKLQMSKVQILPEDFVVFRG